MDFEEFAHRVKVNPNPTPNLPVYLSPSLKEVSLDVWYSTRCFDLIPQTLMESLITLYENLSERLPDDIFNLSKVQFKYKATKDAFEAALKERLGSE